VFIIKNGWHTVLT